MREIKFRGKQLEDIHENANTYASEKGTWRYGTYKYIHKFYDGVNAHMICDIYGREIMCDKNTIGQFTGLKDKNGVEIYEGDVIQYDDNKKWYGSKIWEMYGLGMSFAEIDEHIAKLPPHTVNVEIPSIYEITELQEYKVIGNIHKGEIK